MLTSRLRLPTLAVLDVVLHQPILDGLPEQKARDADSGASPGACFGGGSVWAERHMGELQSRA